MNQLTVSITQAAGKIDKLSKKISKEGGYVVLLRTGRPESVLLSVKEFESFKETVEVLREFPELPEEYRRIKRALEKGEGASWKNLEEVVSEYEGYKINERASQEYGVQNKNNSSSRKRAKKASKK